MLYDAINAETDRAEFARLKETAHAAGIGLFRSQRIPGEWVYIVTRWGWCKEFDSLQALTVWLEKQGVR